MAGLAVHVRDGTARLNMFLEPLGVAAEVSLTRKSKRPLFLTWRTDEEYLMDRDVRLDGNLDISAASINHDVYLYHLGSWSCRFSSMEACATQDVAYKRFLEYFGD